jgi:hypothetical protein
MEGIIQQEGIAIVNIYLMNVDELNFLKQILLNMKTQINPNTIIVHDFTVPLLPINT